MQYFTIINLLLYIIIYLIYNIYYYMYDIQYFTIINLFIFFPSLYFPQTTGITLALQLPVKFCEFRLEVVLWWTGRLFCKFGKLVIQSVIQSVVQSVIQSVIQSVVQSVIQSVIQSVVQSVIQAVIQSFKSNVWGSIGFKVRPEKEWMIEVLMKDLDFGKLETLDWREDISSSKWLRGGKQIIVIFS